MAALDGVEPTDIQFDTLLGQLIQDVRNHVQEENAILPKLVAACTAGQLDPRPRCRVGRPAQRRADQTADLTPRSASGHGAIHDRYTIGAQQWTWVGHRRGHR